MNERVLQSSFNAGEFSPLARDRADLAAYFQGAEIIDNMFPMVEGPLRRRSGLRLVGEVKTSSAPTRIIDFTKSDEDTVLIEAGTLYLRFYDGDTMAPILSGGSPYEIASPFSQTQLPHLYWSQIADVMFFTSRLATLEPRALRRYDDANWSIIAYIPKFGPFAARNEGTISVTPSVVSGSGFLTASAPLFQAEHVNARFRLWEPELGVPYDKWMPQTAVAANELREYAGNVYEAAGAGTTSDQPPVHESGAVADKQSGGVTWTYRHDLSGSVKVTVFTSTTQVSVTVEERLPGSAATKNWAQSSFSDVMGWPRLVGAYEGRLVFASTIAQPDTIFLSRTDGYNADEADFKQSKGNDTVEDDHAIVRTLADNQVNIPAFMAFDEQMILGTARGLIRITGPSVDEPMTPAGASARRIPGTKPAGKGPRAFIADDAILYWSVGGKKLYEYLSGNPVRTLNNRASHVGGSPIADACWCGEPWNRYFARDKTGRLWAMTYDRAESVIAWTRVTVGGAFQGAHAVVEDLVALKDANGFDRLCLVVKRTLAGATKRTIERLDPDFEADRQLPDTANMMDCAIGFDFWNATATTVTVTAAAGAAAGDAATIAASSGTPFAGMAGKELRVRKVSAPARADDAVGELSMTIDTVTGGGASADVTLLTDPDEDEKLINKALTQWGFPSAVITGLSFFNNEQVRVAADGMDFGLMTPAAGQITLDEKAMRGFVGFDVPFSARSLPLLRQMRDGTSRGKLKKLREAVLSFHETGDGAVHVRAIEDGIAHDAQEAGGRTEADYVGAAPPLRSFIQEIGLSGMSGEEVQIEIFGAGAMPATLRSAAIDYESD